MVEREEPRRRICECRNGDHGVHIGGHRFRSPFERAALQCERARIDRIHQRAAVFQNAHVHAVTRSEHLAFDAAPRALQIRNPRLLFGIEDDPCGVFTDGNHARRERLTHAANDALIVEWARTLRIDAPSGESLATRLTAALAHDGVRVRCTQTPGAPAYALVEGPQGVNPLELQARLPEAVWYGEAIIALAIEPEPPDALQPLADALGGPGAPAGVRFEIRGSRAIVEVEPSVTSPALVLQLADVELRRFHGSRRTELLAPLSAAVAAAVAAGGLQCAEMAPDRILEPLLELDRVE